MRSLLVACAALSALPAQASDSAPEMELAVRATATRLVAFNPTDRLELIHFASADQVYQANVIVPARAWVNVGFPAAVAADLRMYVMTRTDLGVVRSQVWTYSELVLATDAFVWFDYGRGHAHTWLEDGDGFALIQPAGDDGPTEHPECPLPLIHVPVITPSDVQKTELPPRLEKEPLPPL